MPEFCWQFCCTHPSTSSVLATCRRERSRAVTAVFGGLDVGSAVGLVLCGPLIKHVGWPSVFYLFAGLGLLWTLLFPQLKPEEPDLLVPSELQPDLPGIHCPGQTVQCTVHSVGMQTSALLGCPVSAAQAMLAAKLLQPSLKEVRSDVC